MRDLFDLCARLYSVSVSTTLSPCTTLRVVCYLSASDLWRADDLSVACNLKYLDHESNPPHQMVLFGHDEMVAHAYEALSLSSQHTRHTVSPSYFGFRPRIPDVGNVRMALFPN